jgi:nucleoside-diphosphate-sugar epimerase
MNKKKIIILGGGGYCGNVVTRKLLEKNYEVTIYDTFWYGKQCLIGHKNLKLIEGDIRDKIDLSRAISGHDFLLHLSCISNDSSFELDEKLSTSINLDSFEDTVKLAKEKNVKRFVFASSSSVYGISDQKNVKEDHPLLPLTLYNKFKGMCEPILFQHVDENFEGVIFRPATVCGYSPRQRLDLSVNILTNHAINKKKITVFGGDQLRPNLHIDDYADVAVLLIEAEKSKVNKEIFNVGAQNLSILNIAKIVKKIVEQEFLRNEEISMEITESDDKRSYHINSDKIKDKLNFVPKKKIEDAVRDLCKAFKNGKLPNSFDDDIYFNVKRMKNLKVL